MARPRITPSNTKRAIGVAKVVVPAVAPFAIKAAGYARHRWDSARARRLGVPVDQLPAISGKGAALNARLARLATSLQDLAARTPDDADTAEFVQRSQARLANLTAAMRAAELMPTGRRRAAYKAVRAELNVIEGQLLGRLGLKT
jgi:predicted flap endonuclease-1-like 5' DNA nuclease